MCVEKRLRVSFRAHSAEKPLLPPIPNGFIVRKRRARSRERCAVTRYCCHEPPPSRERKPEAGQPQRMSIRTFGLHSGFVGIKVAVAPSYRRLALRLRRGSSSDSDVLQDLNDTARQLAR